MTRMRIISLSVALLLASAAAQAQQDQPRETAPAQIDSHSQDTAPAGMGSSDTSGSPIGKSDAHTTGSGSIANSSAADQPLTATGEDLKGPPTRFPANRTPE